MINLVPYDKNGYLDMERIAKESACTPFVVIIGARQTGKTFGTYEYLSKAHPDECIMWLRRTEKEREMMSSGDVEKNPFADQEHSRRCGHIETFKDFTAFYESDQSETPFARAYALSTSGNMRGVSYPWANIIVFDEFIPTVTARPVKGEEYAFNDLYDTVNGNRELKGKPPVKVYLLANSNDISAPILSGLNLTGKVLHMIARKQEVYINPQAGVSIYLINNSPISQRRKQSALQRLTGSNAYAAMSSGNDFSFNSFDGIKSMPLKEYRAILTCGDLTVFKHKSKGLWYMVDRQFPSRVSFPGNETGRKAALRYLVRFKFPFILVDGVEAYFNNYQAKKIWHSITNITEK